MRDNVRNVSRGRAGRERWEFALDNRQIAAVAVGALVIVGSSFVLGMNAGKGMAHQAKPASDNPIHALEAAPDQLPTPPPPKQWEFEKLAGAKPQGGAATPAPPAPAQARLPPPARPLPPRPSADSAPATATAQPAATPGSATAPAPDAAQKLPAQSTASGGVAALPDAAKPAAAPASAAAAGTKVIPAADAHGSAMEKAVAAVGGAPVKNASLTPAAAPKPAAAKPAAKAAPVSAGAQSGTPGAYVIQIGASPSRAEADRIARKFASRGARVIAADVNGKRMYRVRLVSTTYADRAEAEHALARLNRETGVRGFVTSAR